MSWEMSWWSRRSRYCQCLAVDTVRDCQKRVRGIFNHSIWPELNRASKRLQYADLYPEEISGHTVSISFWQLSLWLKDVLYRWSAGWSSKLFIPVQISVPVPVNNAHFKFLTNKHYSRKKFCPADVSRTSCENSKTRAARTKWCHFVLAALGTRTNFFLIVEYEQALMIVCACFLLYSLLRNDLVWIKTNWFWYNKARNSQTH